MKRMKRIVSTGLMLCILAGGATVFGQKKDDQRVPPKDSAPKVPVTPKKEPPKNSNGQNDKKNDKKRP